VNDPPQIEVNLLDQTIPFLQTDSCLEDQDWILNLKIFDQDDSLLSCDGQEWLTGLLNTSVFDTVPPQVLVSHGMNPMVTFEIMNPSACHQLLVPSEQYSLMEWSASQSWKSRRLIEKNFLSPSSLRVNRMKGFVGWLNSFL
jgi:hypothetical protein